MKFSKIENDFSFLTDWKEKGKIEYETLSITGLVVDTEHTMFSFV